MKGPLLALAALTTVTVTGHAQAQIMKNPTFLASEAQTYFGFGIGHSKHKKYCDAIQSIPSFIGSCDDSGEAVKVFGGYKFKSWVGMELGYTNLGRSSADGLFNGTPVIGRWKGSGVDLSAGLYWPLGEYFELMAKAGVVRWDIKSTNDFMASGETRDAGYSPIVGIGATWFFSPQAGLHVRYERMFDVGDPKVQVKTDIDMVTLNLLGRF